MNAPSPANESENNVAELLSALASHDAFKRGKSRLALVALGTQEVTSALVNALSDPVQQMRWEAAKALTAIADPVSAEALVDAMDDDDQDVRWVASEGVIALQRPGLLALLTGLTKRARSTAFCTSAHHVLHDLSVQGFADVVAPVIAALEHSEPGVAAPPAAHKALAAVSQADDESV